MWDSAKKYKIGISTNLAEPVMRTRVSLPERSVTCWNWNQALKSVNDCYQIINKQKTIIFLLTMKVSLKEAKIWATPNTCSPSRTAGPRVTFSSLGSLFFLFDWDNTGRNTSVKNKRHKKNKIEMTSEILN